MLKPLLSLEKLDNNKLEIGRRMLLRHGELGSVFKWKVCDWQQKLAF